MKKINGEFWFQIKKVLLVILIVTFVFCFFVFGKSGFYFWIDSLILGSLFTFILVCIMNYFNWFYFDDKNKAIIFYNRKLDYEKIKEFRVTSYFNNIYVVKQNNFNLAIPFIFKFNLVKGLKKEHKTEVLEKIKNKFPRKKIKKSWDKSVVFIITFIFLIMVLNVIMLIKIPKVKVKNFKLNSKSIEGNSYKTKRFKFILPEECKKITNNRNSESSKVENKIEFKNLYKFETSNKTKLIIKSKKNPSKSVAYNFKNPVEAVINDLSFPISKYILERKLALFPLIIKDLMLKRGDVIYNVSNFSFKAVILMNQMQGNNIGWVYLVSPNKKEEVIINIETNRDIKQLISYILNNAVVIK